MAEPIKKTYSQKKEPLMALVCEAVKDANLEPIGQNRELGLISFRNKKGLMYYIHITPANGETGHEVAAAPGLSCFGERNTSEFDAAVIHKVLQKLEDRLQKV